MPKSKLKKGSEDPTAAAVRKALNVSDDEEVIVQTPQFERLPGKRTSRPTSDTHSADASRNRRDNPSV